MENKPQVVDFNQRLNLVNLKTTHSVGNQKVDIKDPKYFLGIYAYFNFNEDRIEFMLNVTNEKLKIEKESAHFKFSNDRPIDIPIILSQRKSGNEMCNTTFHANFKDRLLHLFEADQKEFLLTICYAVEKKRYTSSFSVSLPKIEAQNDRVPKKKSIQIYNPEDIGGFELKKLFEKNLMPYSASTPEERKLLNALKSYKDADFEDRFKNLDFLGMFQFMVAIEDLEGSKQMRDHSLDSVSIYKYNSCPVPLQQTVKQHLSQLMDDEEVNVYAQTIYIIEAKKKLSVDVMDFNFVHIKDQRKYRRSSKLLENSANQGKVGKIDHIFGDVILVRISSSSGRKNGSVFNKNRLYHVEFVPNRASIRTAQRALNDMKLLKMSSYLQNFEMKGMNRSSKEYFTTFKWFNSTLTDNQEQQIAVKNIVNCTSFPSPFIIFGGPGTGKSTTVVEAIAQVVKLKPKSHVLITASSNSTCDDIGNRLLKYISINKILRIYSPSFDQKPEKIDNVLKRISNFRKRKNCEENSSNDPSFKELSTARVVIVTVVGAGRIISSGFPANHFDYIFIDEAGFVTEPDSYIPLSGLGLSQKGVHAQIVLSGDHKQLGPIVTNKFAKDMGLETSLMERLMDNDKKYQRSENGYNHDYVVQLTQNYRNHPAIMQFSNENFYNSQLVSVCSEKIKNFAADPNVLLFNKDFPIIFHTNKSLSEEVGTSLKNEGELIILTIYIKVILKKGLGKNKVKETDIGIISPYRGQRDRMIEVFRKAHPNIEIGTVDSFQGREKKIIFMSCVRSGTSHVGFLRNEKRLNVALTRAQSLLVIIGNASTLQKCSIWNEFIAYCYENKATVGDLKSIDYEKIANRSKTIKEELPEDDIIDEYDV